MSCLYADMILDLRKNSMNEVEKRFIDEKLKTGKKRFCPKVPASTNAQREIFFSYVCTLVKLQKKLLKYPLILKTKFDLIFIPSISFQSEYRPSKRMIDQFLVWGIGDF